jgi:hypothetical protein
MCVVKIELINYLSARDVVLYILYVCILEDSIVVVISNHTTSLTGPFPRRGGRFIVSRFMSWQIRTNPFAAPFSVR